MLKLLVAGCVVFALSAGLGLSSPLDGKATYDLLFRNGTLDTLSRNTTLIYTRSVQNTLKPETVDRDTGDVALSLREGDSDREIAQLEFRQEDKHRSLGVFPASVGNPMIMFFYEAVVRDMAESAGGSPFYIRNRVKEALVTPSDVEPGEAVVNGVRVKTQTVRLVPFAKDPNRERMKGFGDLTLSVTMSDAVPGWYVSLVAEAAPEGSAPVYRMAVEYQGTEAAQ